MPDFFNKYPYTDFHELNLDWIIKTVKETVAEWAVTLTEWHNTQEEWQQLYDYVHDYFDNLNVQTEINNKINDMISDGTFALIVTPIINAKVEAGLPAAVSSQMPGVVADQIGGAVADQIGDAVNGVVGPYIAPAVTDWLDANCNPVGSAVMVDNTLTIGGAAADALVTGTRLTAVENMFPYSETRQPGFLKADGTYLVAGTFISITRTYKVQEGDVFIYNGIGDGSSVMALLKANNVIISTISGYFKYVPKIITIPNGIDELVLSSFADTGDYNDVVLKVYQRENVRTSASLYNHNLLYEAKNVSYIQANGKIANVNTFYSYTRGYDADGIKVFKFTGKGDASAVACLKVLDGSIVGTISGDYRNNPLYVLNDGTFDTIVFSSYDATTDYDEVTFDIECTYDTGNGYTVVNDISHTYKDFPYYMTRQPGFLTSSDTYNGATFYSETRVYENVKNGDVIRYRGIGNGSAVFVIYYDAYGSIVSSASGSYLTDAIEITIPSGIAKIKLSSFSDTTYDDIYIKTEYIDRSTFYTVMDDIARSYKDVLKGKKWIACGDSFTEGSELIHYVDDHGRIGVNSDAYDQEWEMYKSYPWFIARRNDMDLVMDGVSGSTMAITRQHQENPGDYPIGYKAPFSYQRYQQIPADVDYITLWFNINDQANCYIGNINDTTNLTTYGAWNVVMEYLITNYPKAKIGIIVTDAIQADRMGFADCCRNIARKWGVGYLDLQADYHVPLTLDVNARSELSAAAKTIRNTQYYINNSNHHPNLLAYEQMSTFIEHWMRSL